MLNYAKGFVGTDHDDGDCLGFVTEAWVVGGIALGTIPSRTAASYWSSNPRGIPRARVRMCTTTRKPVRCCFGVRRLPRWGCRHRRQRTAHSMLAAPTTVDPATTPCVFLITLSQCNPVTITTSAT